MEYIALVENAIKKITQQRNNAYGDSIGICSAVWSAKYNKESSFTPIDHCLMMIDLKSVRGKTAQHNDTKAFIDTLEDIIGYALLAGEYIDDEDSHE